MNTSKDSSAKESDREWDSDSISSSASVSSSQEQDYKYLPIRHFRLLKSRVASTTQPWDLGSCQIKAMSMEYTTPEDLNMSETLLPDPCVDCNDMHKKIREIPRAVCGLPGQRNYPQRAAQLSESINEAEYSPKALPQKLLTQHNRSQPTPKWKTMILLDVENGHLDNFPLGIIRLTFKPTAGTTLAGEDAEQYTAEYKVNLPPPGVPWVSIPSPGPYKPKPKPKSKDEEEDKNEILGAGGQDRVSTKECNL